jgi:Flp pilus assembly protein TadD
MPVEPRRVLRSFPKGLFALRRAFASVVLGCCLLGVWAAGWPPACGQARSPQTLAKDADAAYERGDVQEAIGLYEELIKIQPGSVEARTNLGVALARVGRYNDAVAQYDDALTRAPDNPRILLNLALAWYKQAAFDQAVVKLEHMRTKHLENRQSLYLLADCYLRLGRNLDAVSLLQPAYIADPNDRAVDFALGTALIRAGQIGQGEVIIEQVAKTGNQSEVELLTGAAQFAAHDSKAAASTIHKLLESEPNLPGAWLLYARALLDSGDHEGARAAFLKALQADRNDFEANLYLGGMLRYDGNTEDAAPYLEKAQMLRPASVEPRFQIGLLNLARGRLQDALSDLQKVEHQSPDFKEVHVQLAVLYARLHRIEDSERERAAVIQLDEKAREQVPSQSQP